MENKSKENLSALSDKNKRLIIIFTAAFLGLVILFGVILGTVAIVRNSRAYLSYRGVTIDGGVANYLAMMAKYDYMSSAGVQCYDDEQFWQSKSEEGTTYGELLAAHSDAYIKRVLIGAYFFDRNAKLSKEDKKNIDDAVSIVVGNFSDREAFDEAADERGFNLRDVKRGAELIYKYTLAKTVIFGYDGEALKGGAFDTELDEFYSEYSYVKLLFIRTNDKYTTDPSTGKAVLEELDDAGRELVQDKIERIRYLISGVGDELISEDTIDYYLDEFSADEMNRKTGYYLSSTSAHTNALNAAYPEVVRAALSADENSYTEVETKHGVCFIFKKELPVRGYIYPSNDIFFSDFYSQAAGFIYFKELTSYSSDVKAKDAYLELEPTKIPYDYKLVLRF